MRLKQVMPRQTQEKLKRPAAARQSPWQLGPNQARQKPSTNMPCDSGERVRGKLWKTVETNCSKAIAVAARSKSSEAEAKTGMRIGQVRPKQIWPTRPRPAAARQSGWQLEQLKRGCDTQGARPRELKKTAEASCSEAIEAAARVNSSEAAPKTCHEHRGSEAEAKARKTAETSCSEARAAAVRANSSEAEAKPCKRLKLKTQAKEMRCLERVTTKAGRPFPSS
jgi:hypothetical protein